MLGRSPSMPKSLSNFCHSSSPPLPKYSFHRLTISSFFFPPLFFFAIVLLRRNSGQKRFGLVKDIGGEVKRRAKRRKTKAAWEAFCEIVTALATRFYGLPRRAKEHRAAFDSEPMLRLPTRSRTSRKHNVWQATKYLGTSHNPSKQGNNDAARLKGQRREGNRGYD